MRTIAFSLLDAVIKVALDDQVTSRIGAVANGAKTALGGIGKAGIAAVGAASAAVVAVTKQSVEAYASYEQLAGGVETLFGESANTVMEFADNAFKTAGLSANDYMETVTSFSASLLQGLGGDTAQAADMANMAITDMSDNANKMGTSMSSIQNAYQGFAKSNYTMLDNLKLGYGGTQAEMVRLINDSGILEDTITDLDGITFDQIVSAIHEVQTNLGITGTTAKEASTTIEGSANAMKAAWENMLTGLADDNANFDELVGNLVESVGTFADNLIPRIETALEGVGQLITALAPKIAAALPELVTTILPSIIESAVGIVNALVTALTENAPAVITAGIQMLIMLINGLAQALPQLIAKAPEIITALVTGIISALPQIASAGLNVIQALAEGIGDAIDFISETIDSIDQAIYDGIMNLVNEATTWGIDLMNNFIDGIASMIGNLISTVSSVASTVKSFLGFSEPEKGPLSNFHTYAPDMMELFAQGIRDNVHVITNQLNKSLDFRKDLDFVVPSGYYEGKTVGDALQSAMKEFNINTSINLDGATVAKKLYKYNQAENDFHGDSLIRV